MKSFVRSRAPLKRYGVMLRSLWLVLRDFFWLHTDAPGKQREIEAMRRVWPVLLAGVLLVLSLCTSTHAADTPPDHGQRNKFPCQEKEIARYTVYRVNEPILSTFSSGDSLLSKVFPLALRRPSDVGERALTVTPNKYAALGGAGPHVQNALPRSHVLAEIAAVHGEARSCCPGSVVAVPLLLRVPVKVLSGVLRVMR